MHNWMDHGKDAQLDGSWKRCTTGWIMGWKRGWVLKGLNNGNVYVIMIINRNRILENRKYFENNYYETFIKKITVAFDLERRIEENKFSKEHINQARMHYVVFLVSCLECYLGNIFKKYIDSNLIDQDKLLKIDRIKQLKFKSSDLLEFEKENIKISEIIIGSLNFQNVNGKAKPYQVKQLLKVIEKYHLTEKKNV